MYEHLRKLFEVLRKATGKPMKLTEHQGTHREILEKAEDNEERQLDIKETRRNTQKKPTEH